MSANTLGIRPRLLKRRLGSPLGTSFLSSGLIQGVNVLTGIILARALGPAGRGDLTAVLLWPFMLVAVGGLGMSDAATYLTARRSAPLGSVVGTAVVISVVQSTLLMGVGAIVVPVALGGHGHATVAAALIFLPIVPLYLLTVALMGILNGSGRNNAFQTLRVLVVGVTGVLLVAFWAAGMLTVRSAVAAYLIANVVTLLSSAAAVGDDEMRLRFDRQIARKLLSYGAKAQASTVSAVANERLDQLVISIFLAPAQLGLYVIAVTMTSATALVGSSVSFVALPAVARLESTQDRAAAARRFLTVTLLASVAFTLPVMLFTGPLIRLLFGTAYLGALGVCRILLVASVVLSAARAVGAVLKALGRPADAGISEFAALGVTCVALAVLLPTSGILGASIASLLAYSVSATFCVRRASRALEISARELLRPRLAANSAVVVSEQL